jgi:hypothetical protein
MHHLRHCGVAALALAALAGCSDNDAISPGESPSLGVSETGSGAPSGAHYTLNIIGVEKGKSVNMDQAAGHVIFVALGSKTGEAVTSKIYLKESTDGSFGVLDKNGTDGRAEFLLPAPEGGTAYQVYARALGTPQGKATLTTCAEGYVQDGIPLEDEVCSTENKVFERTSGRSRFENVTQQLTTIVVDEELEEAAYLACGGADTDANTGEVRVDIFDDCLYDYFWKYDNNGLRVLQVRFYPTN